MQAKLNTVIVEKEQAVKRANSVDQALGVERSLKDQLTAQLEAKDEAMEELRKKMQSMENEKKEAEDVAVRAEMDSFRLGYDNVVLQAKKLGLEYKMLLLNPDVDTMLAMESGDRGGGCGRDSWVRVLDVFLLV